MAKSQRRKKRNFFGAMVVVPLFAILLVLIPNRKYSPADEPKIPQVRDTEINFAPSKYPIKTSWESGPQISASAAAVLDLESGVFLLEKNTRQQMRPASLTKMVTALVTLDKYQPDDVLITNNLINGKGESQMGLINGDQVTVKNLLYGLLIASGNDAAQILAQNSPNFLDAMNQKATALNLTGTHFDNPIGTDSQNQYTTVHDMTTLAKEILKNELLGKIVATNWIMVTDTSGQKKYPLQNVNQLLQNFWGTIGVKTGTTLEAGQCLVLANRRSGRTILTVVLNSRDRFTEAALLTDWAFRTTTPSVLH